MHARLRGVLLRTPVNSKNSAVGLQPAEGYSFLAELCVKADVSQGDHPRNPCLIAATIWRACLPRYGLSILSVVLFGPHCGGFEPTGKSLATPQARHKDVATTPKAAAQTNASNET